MAQDGTCKRIAVRRIASVSRHESGAIEITFRGRAWQDPTTTVMTVPLEKAAAAEAALGHLARTWRWRAARQSADNAICAPSDKRRSACVRRVSGRAAW